MAIPARGLRFLAAQQGLLGRPPLPEVIRDADGSVLDVVEPRGAYRGTVLSVHGMSPAAQRDPRLQRLHGALSRVGFRVVAPHFPSIAALRVHVGQIDDLERSIVRVARDRRLTPDGRLGVFSVSFSAGLSLVAAGRPGPAERITALCSVGAYGDIEAALDALLTRTDMTTYAWKIVLANFLEASIGDRPDVREALLVSALDEWHGRIPELPAFLASVAPEDAALVRTLLADPGVRRAHHARIVATRPLFLDLGSVVDHVDRVVAPVTLLHGRGDATIPAEQSQAIHAAREAAGRPSRLLVSPLLSHGDAALSAKALAGLPELLETFEAWFDEAATRRPRGLSRLVRPLGVEVA